jgi:rod shape-determining protein MreC
MVLFTYNRFHRAKGLGVGNQITGWFNTQYNTLEDYFKMKEENRRIHKLNDSLMNLLPANFIRSDTSTFAHGFYTV